MTCTTRTHEEVKDLLLCYLNFTYTEQEIKTLLNAHPINLEEYSTEKSENIINVYFHKRQDGCSNPMSVVGENIKKNLRALTTKSEQVCEKQINKVQMRTLKQRKNVYFHKKNNLYFHKRRESRSNQMVVVSKKQINKVQMRKRKQKNELINKNISFQ